MSRTAYQNYLEEVVKYHLEQRHQIISDWKGNIQQSNLFGYSPTSYPAVLGVVLGFRYQQTGDETYARLVADLLLEYEEIKKIYPKQFYAHRIEYKKGLPPLADFFDMSAYARAYRFIQKSTSLSSTTRQTLEQGIADCANFLFNFPEWGPMNRAMLRALTYLVSARTLPAHSDAPRWQKMADVLVKDSYQRWEAEDAAIYHPVWLMALFNFVDLKQDDDFFKSSIPRYYLDYFLHQMTPLVSLPDYGDAWWPSEAIRWVAIFEKGAAVYQEPLYKWAAHQFWNFQLTLTTPVPDIHIARTLIDAILWSDESLPEKSPKGESRLVMEESVGKKIVLRNGTNPESTYLLLNYRDEGTDSYLFREYMRSTITAEEERTHHSHADENAIISLIHQGSILLHDAGYRPFLPSGDYGAFRADYFHNRLVVRKNRRWIRLEGQREEQSLWEMIRNSGFYRPVETQLIDFWTFQKFDYSRTRLKDVEMGYEWDRILVYHKKAGFFIVVDGIKFLRRDIFTLANLWHTQKILSSGENWFNTRIDNILNYKISGNQELLVNFPIIDPERYVGNFDINRHNQPEKALYETISDFFYENQFAVFVTVLFPHEPGVPVDSILKNFQIIPSNQFPRAVGLKMNINGKEEYLAVKLDLNMDYAHRTWRPRYDYELGKVQYDVLETDANLAFISADSKRLYWAASYMTQLHFKGQVIHQSPPASFGMQPSGSPEVLWKPSKWRAWEEEREA
ncbi:hypothetical protein JW964_01010 [candidate division KSB1 bacterium]|nr:hypothetical protein [candidate division KSB1 bacterium]